MTAATLGPALGKAYVPGYGMGTVFDSDKPGFFSVQVERTGIRYWVSRENVRWRK